MSRSRELPSKLTEQSIKDLPIEDSRYDVEDHLVPGLYLTVHPSGEKSWVYRYKSRDKSKRHRIGDDSISPAAARAFANRIASDVAEGIDPSPTKKEAEPAGTTLEEGTLRAFIEKRYEPRATLEATSGAANAQTIKNSFEFLLDRPMTSINHREIEKWCRNRHKNGIPTATTNRLIAALRACLSKAIDWDVIDEHPLQGFELTGTDSENEPSILSEDQEKALRAALRARDTKKRVNRVSANKWRKLRHAEPKSDYGYFVDHLEPIVLLALNTGLRHNEILRLRWSDVLPDSLIVRDEKAASRHRREIPLNDEAQEILENWESSSEWVFPGRGGSRLTTFKKAWAAIRKDAGLMDVRFRDLRRTFGTRLLQRGSDIETVRALLGHSDIRTTARYFRATDDSKRKAVALLQ